MLIRLIWSISQRAKEIIPENFFQEVEDNSKKFWTKINEILNKKCNGKSNIFLSENGQIITNQSLVANIFNNHFLNVSYNLLKGLGETNNQYQDQLKIPINIAFSQTTPDEVAGVLKSFETKKASNLHGISPKFVKISADVIEIKTVYNN